MFHEFFTLSHLFRKFALPGSFSVVFLPDIRIYAGVWENPRGNFLWSGFNCRIISNQNTGKSFWNFQRVVAGQQIQTVLIHTGSFCFSVFSKCAVQAFGNSQFELSGIILLGIWLTYLDSFLYGSCKPLPFCVFCIFQCLIHRISDRDATWQVRISGHISPLFRIRPYLQTIRKIQVILNCLHFAFHPLRPIEPSQHKSF